MKNIDIAIQTDPEGQVERPEAEGSEENIPKTHQRTESSEKNNKRARFDKDGKPMVSKGILIRKDLDRKYSIKATFIGKHKYELINDALEYYYAHILSKSESKQLKEAGQEELEV